VKALLLSSWNGEICQEQLFEHDEATMPCRSSSIMCAWSVRGASV